MEPSRPVVFAAGHLFEAISTVDLGQLVGGRAGGAAEAAASKACSAEFSAFAGLAGPSEDIWPTWLTTVEQAGAGRSAATCLVASRTPRSGTARQVAR